MASKPHTTGDRGEGRTPPPESERPSRVLQEMAGLVGRKWQLLIVHRLLENGALGFNALQSDLDGISSKVLSNNLADLEDRRVVERTVVDTRPCNVEYSLTDAGRSLEPLVESMYDWGRTYLDGE